MGYRMGRAHVWVHIFLEFLVASVDDVRYGENDIIDLLTLLLPWKIPVH
jgi:hypothetical protein